MESYCGWCHQTDEPLLLPGKPIMPVSQETVSCPQCHWEIILVSISKASEVAGVSRKTIYQWIDKGLVSTVRSSSGRLRVCFSSLFSPSSKKDRESLE